MNDFTSPCSRVNLMGSPLKREHTKSQTRPRFCFTYTISNHYRTLEDCVNGGSKANGTAPNSAAVTVFAKLYHGSWTNNKTELSAIEIKIRNYLPVDSSSLHWLRRNVPMPALGDMCSDFFVESTGFSSKCISCLKDCSSAQQISFL